MPLRASWDTDYVVRARPKMMMVNKLREGRVFLVGGEVLPVFRRFYD